MNRKVKLLVFLLLSLMLTSCFEFVEEVTFNKDGSGSAVLTINLSKSKTKLASIMLLDSVNGYKVPSKSLITKKVKEVVTKIKNLKGVHNVKNSLNLTDFIVTVSCDFDNVEVLNSVIANFNRKKDAKKTRHFLFDKNKKAFTRSHHFDFSKEVRKMKMKDREIFETASYTSIYRFKSPIKKFQNKQARLSKTKKAIMLKVPVQEVIINKKTIKNYIELEG